MIMLRLGEEHARRRLALEQRRERQVTKKAQFLRRESWYAHPHVIQALLRATGLYRRGQRNAEQVVLRRNLLQMPDYPSAFDGLTILHLSDLHADSSPGALECVLRLIAGVDYDICVMTGDYRGPVHGSCDPALHAMARLRDRIRGDAFAVLGNHDSLALASGLESIGFRLLLNESEALERAGQRIFIAGIDDAHYFGTADIPRARSSIPAGAFSILLSHTPEVFAEAAAAGFKLMLSGHTHGGQICLPGSIAVTLDSWVPRRIGAGAWQHGGMHGYTSKGVGTSIVPVRFNCPPEITLHELQRV
jgi:predicted MPP superfamily phosphohydrolase